MKNFIHTATRISLALSFATAAFGQNYTQVNLVANAAGIAPVTDPTLINPWGLSRSSNSPWWVSDNGSGLSTLYNGAGAKQSLIVTIPKADPNSKTFPTGTPTGTIFNGAQTDFLISGKPATFLFATLDGTISAWNAAVAVAPGAAPPSTNAVVAVKTTDGSVYTGLTSAFVGGKPFLYAANSSKGRVDVYDNNFAPVTLPREKGATPAFVDSQLPPNYNPFNVQTVGNDVVVTYALIPPGQPRETDGPGLGYVDVYSSTGVLILRLEHGDWLNAPWGVALAPQDFGLSSHKLLIGQFAGGGTTENSGTIAIYDLVSGQFEGQIRNSVGTVLAINGLWALSPANSVAPGSYDAAGSPGAEIYFTAGPNQGTGGLFGYLKPFVDELTEGNSQ
ncbi:TIGR03118 family protein [Tunturiibacter gelidoferens]|jgi:uncharacterized protein (TIGR03118 family)|uniref:Uncharacterized protein (TIGR03118 family) n=1 Tax=Tunturiibacter gelidiferens TaxID=3069689 RepID=A0A9X0U753_9BACT|nr:TIGR03118 family protein [Edaphobacter lichenicola]MBB5330607.1 uncharacterized protein (TIGR03118 family) [Edaphobacter lichenicola]